MNTLITDPEEIEKKSFEMITAALEETDVLINGCEHVSDERILCVIKRCIHTTADFDYAKTMCFSPGAVERLASLIREGATVVTDTNMALSGINKKLLEKYGCRLLCFMADEDVSREAKNRGVTRAQVSMEHAMSIEGPVIFVVGNAPTALITLREHFDRSIYRPAFIVGVPVGFVNVTFSKEMIMQTDIDYIINSGQKGGSNVAAAIVNMILIEMRNGIL